MKFITVSNTGVEVAGERYVGTTQAPIQRATEYLRTSGGGVIFIERGTYLCSSEIRVYSNTEIFGEGMHTAVVRDIANTSSSFSIFMALGSDENRLENIFIHDLLIGGLNARANNTTGIGIHNVGQRAVEGVGYKKGATISSCYISYCGTSSISMTLSANCIIEFNTVSFCDWGISVSTSQDLIINGNRISNISNEGLYSNYGISDSIISNNILSNCLLNGIRLNASASVTVQGNSVINCKGTYGIGIQSSNFSSVIGNSIQNTERWGIGVGWGGSTNVPGCTHCNVSGNLSSNNDLYGLDNDKIKHIAIIGNSLVHNGVTGVFFGTAESDDSIIAGNTSAYNYRDDASFGNLMGNIVVGNRFSVAVAFFNSQGNNGATTGVTESNMIKV